MGPGMPGIGIAGIFYVIAAVLAPARELYLTARGRSSRARWLLVLRQFLLAWVIVGTVVGFYMGLNWMAHQDWLGAWGDRGLQLFTLPNLAVGVLILGVALGVTAAYAFLVRNRADEDPDVIAFDHRHSTIRGKADRTLLPVPDSTAGVEIRPQFPPAARTVPARVAAIMLSDSHGIVVSRRRGERRR